ncbi:hypothetical protein SAMN05216410_1326 [Sanguibacter gelidistatuariae]|uniref:Uncharacterized protein n=2 Tax=Sanguibacter gelidistatuariae TaxID=1814289 RepID=A0A1G6JFP9_9MICO|nr:hypothetical protein SAMN05216410_1326 [Sanguibacter gelidistatuariae]
MPPGSLIASDHEALKHLAGLVGDCSDDAVLWVTFLSADDRALALVLPIDDLPSMPDNATTAALAAAMRDVVGKVYPGAQALVAIVRPTGGDYGDHERSWADALWRAADATGWSIRMIAAVGADRSRVLDRARCVPHADLR